MNESEKPVTGTFRPGKLHLILGIVSTVLFLIADVVSVYVAYWNIDGSFRYPKWTAIGFGVFWSTWFLAGLWMILTYFREEMVVAESVILKQECFRKKTIQISNVSQIIWKPSGKMIVLSPSSRMKVDLSNFSSDEQDQLTTYFRDTFPPDIQKGWAGFIELRTDSSHRPTPEEARSTAYICVSILFIFAGVFGYCWVAGLGMQWLVIGVLNALAGVWYLWRISKQRKQTSDVDLSS